MEPWLQLAHPITGPEDKWWISSNNPKQLKDQNLDDILQRKDLRAAVIMRDCNSQGREFLRCFTWLSDDTRYMNLLTSRPLDYFLSHKRATSLFGDSYIWLIRPEEVQSAPPLSLPNSP